MRGFSVLLGLSLSRLLEGLARVVVDPARRIHWSPLSWTIQPEVAWIARGLATAIGIIGAVFGTAMVTRNRVYHAVVAMLGLLFAVGSAIGQLPAIA